MKKLIILLPLLALAGCALLPSDSKLADIQAKRVTYICSHQAVTTAAANLAISQADKIKNVGVRDAVKAAAEADLNIVASCPVA